MIALPTGVVVAAVLSAMAWPARSICAVGREWLPEANAPLKVTLSSMAACTQPERKIIYRYLSMEQRKELWRSHWSSFLGEGTKLNAKQQATLRMALSHIDNYFVSVTGGRTGLETDSLTSKRLKAEFGDSLAIAIFAILGPDQKFTGHNLASLLRAQNSATGGPSALQELPYCNCSISSDWCCTGTCSNSVECVTQGGCGTAWMYDCNGLCSTRE